MKLQTLLKSDNSTSIYVIVIDFTTEKLKEVKEKLIITIKLLYLSKKLLNSREKVYKNN